MRKLINKMKFVTVSDAAKELSAALEGEGVTEADVLRLTLDGHLILSVNFVNYVKARRGRFIGFEDFSPWLEYSAEVASTILNTHPEYINEQKMHPKTDTCPAGLKMPFKQELGINDEISIVLDEEVIILHGDYDLFMIGNGRKDIANRYQLLEGGPVVTIQGVEGVLFTKMAIYTNFKNTVMKTINNQDQLPNCAN